MKIKVFCEDLKLGMYISELDHPWIESPFLFQGFLLKEDEEIEQVQATCKYVYVDTEKTPFEVKVNLETIHPVPQKSVKKKKRKPTKIDFTDTVTLKNLNLINQISQKTSLMPERLGTKPEAILMTCLQKQKWGRSLILIKLKF